MTITSTAGLSHGASPLQNLLGSISSKASAGSISAADATALSEAATDIDSTLGSEGASAARSGGSRLSPDDMKSRIEGLVDGEVEKGTLTSEQATTLKELFSQNAPKGGAHGAGGPGGPGGPPPGPPPSDEASGDDGSDTDATGTASTKASGGTSTADLLKSFLEQLRSTQSDTSAYGSTSTASASRFSALLIDYQA